MKVFKKVFKKRFWKKEERKVVLTQTPNRTYLVGTWKFKGVRVKASIVATNGEKTNTKEEAKNKERIQVIHASYVVYKIEVYRQGQKYERYYYYTG